MTKRSTPPIGIDGCWGVSVVSRGGRIKNCFDRRFSSVLGVGSPDKVYGRDPPCLRLSKRVDAVVLRRYVWKMLYIFMLGYEVDFGHMEAMGLISSQKFAEKQVGYIVVAVMLNEVRTRGFRIDPASTTLSLMFGRVRTNVGFRVANNSPYGSSRGIKRLHCVTFLGFALRSYVSYLAESRVPPIGHQLRPQRPHQPERVLPGLGTHLHRKW
jgi:hypothetical protein